MLKLQVFFAIVFISLNHCSPLTSDQTLSYRLPNDSIPLSYDLWILTDIHKSDFTFSGRVKIRIQIKETTQIITLHSRDITVSSVDLFNSNDVLQKSKLKFEFIDETEFIKVDLEREFNPNDEIFLEFSYKGVLTDETKGFFKTYLVTRDFEKEWIALTHFEPSNARQAFICYDEPHIKTPFKLQIRYDKSYQAVSNMPINRNIIDATNYVTTVFEETPPMQTYVLVFVISKLDYISNNRKDFEQRVYGEPEKIQNGTGSFALAVAGEIMDKFSEIFNMTIQIPKLDHFAIPLVQGAAEHYGLITYEEEFLLLNEESDQLILDYFKPSIIGVIAHETSHQYFGNIVTHSWWSYLWLSEGFATFYQYYLPHFLYPQYDFMEKFRNEVLDYAIDDYEETAMNDYVESPFEIQSKFHPLLFAKAASVIRMFFETIGEDVFNDGIIKYLNDRKFNFATPDDLHRSLQFAYNTHHPRDQLDIGKMMSSWENQPGYPVISVERINRSIILKQQKIYDPNSSIIYFIPLTFITQSNAPKSSQVWMTSRTLELSDILTSEDEWIIFNVQQVGYYRMDYSRNLWYSIIKSYPDNIHRINRELLHREMFIAHQTLKTKTLCDCVQLLKVLKHETDGAVWEQAEYINELNRFMLFSDIYPQFQGLLRDVLEPHMHILSNTLTIDKSLLKHVTEWSKVAQHRTYLQHELDKLLKHMLTKDEENKPDFCSAFRIANASIYNFYVDELLNFESFIDMELIFGIGCTLDGALLSNMLKQIIEPKYEISHWMMMDILRATLESSDVGLMGVMEFMAENFEELEKLNYKFVEDMIIFLYPFVNSEDQLKSYKSLTQILEYNKIISSNLVISSINMIEGKLQDSKWKELRVCFNREQEHSSSTCQTETTTLGAFKSTFSIKIITISISFTFFVHFMRYKVVL